LGERIFYQGGAWGANWGKVLGNLGKLIGAIWVKRREGRRRPTAIGDNWGGTKFGSKGLLWAGWIVGSYCWWKLGDRIRLICGANLGNLLLQF